MKKMGLGFLQVPVWLSAGLTRYAYVTKHLNGAARMSPCTAHYYDISHSLIHDLTYKARTFSVQTCEPRDHSACQAWPLVSTTQTSCRMSVARASHFCGLVKGHAWIGPIVNLFVTHYFVVALAMAQGRLAHGPKNIAHSGWGDSGW